MNLVLDGGEDALQMKELSARSGVALATLYRYFPSKQHLLLALLENRYREAQGRLAHEQAHGETVRERVVNYLLRSFRAEMRMPEFTNAVQRAFFHAGPEHADSYESVSAAYLQNVLTAAGTLTETQLHVLPVVLTVASDAARQYLAGHLSQTDVRFQIIAASRLLDAPADVVAEDERLARTTR